MSSSCSHSGRSRVSIHAFGYGVPSLQANSSRLKCDVICITFFDLLFDEAHIFFDVCDLDLSSRQLHLEIPEHAGGREQGSHDGKPELPVGFVFSHISSTSRQSCWSRRNPIFHIWCEDRAQKSWRPQCFRWAESIQFRTRHL